MSYWSGFRLISIEHEKKQRKLFKPIDVIYKPTKSIEIEPLFFQRIFQKHIRLLIQKEKKGITRAHKCYQYHYCNKLFIQEIRQKRHIENCSGRTGVVYNFNNQNLIRYKDNVHAKGDVPFVLYFDFETTAPTNDCLDPEQKKMYVVSYVM